MKYETRTVRLDEIEIDERVQPRASLYPQRVEEIAEAYREGKDIPPIKVHEVQGKLYACDGFHRYAAACQAGLTVFVCRVRKHSTWGALVVDAISSNAIHGQPLTQHEKREAIRKLVDVFQQEPGTWTQADIADITGTSQATVSRVIKELKHVPEEVLAPTHASVEEPPLPSEQLAQQIAESTPEEEPSLDDIAAAIENEISPAREHCKAIYQAARKISESLHELQSLTGGEEACANMSMLTQAKNDLMSIRLMTPKGACPHCGGRKCKRCLQRGWVSEGRHKAVG